MIFYKLQFTFKEADCDFLSALLITCQVEFLLSLLRTDARRVTLARLVLQRHGNRGRGTSLCRTI